ncbi:Ribonucleotide reductase 1 isoform 2 [Hordeum vulgare]|nr:Ribonucleotide reductase 1 isoform 2 [Hordeum vulgare]
MLQLRSSILSHLLSSSPVASPASPLHRLISVPGIPVPTSQQRRHKPPVADPPPPAVAAPLAYPVVLSLPLDAALLDNDPPLSLPPLYGRPASRRPGSASSPDAASVFPKKAYNMINVGAFVVYLEPWHADIFEFLDLRKNHGKIYLIHLKSTLSYRCLCKS